MKQAVPDRWPVQMPGRAPGIVQLPPPLVHPGVPLAAPPPRRAANPLIVATLATAAGLAGAVGTAVLVLVVGATTAPSGASSIDGPVSARFGLTTVATSAPPRVATPVETVVVDVSGGVLQPGLRTLEAGDRVGDAIAAAGGFAPRADLAETSRTVNLAQPLTDGMKVLVPELGADTGPAGQAPADDDGRIDLNSAGQSELETLPGIGPVTAQKIIAAREEQPFGSVDDLRDRGVVGASVFEEIHELVRAQGG